MTAQCGRFENKVAIVSGGADGMGAACVRQLAAEGAAVCAIDVKYDMAQALAEELSAGGAKVAAFKGDVLDEAGFEAALSEAIAAHGRVDALINVAGGSASGLISEIDLEVFDRHQPVGRGAGLIRNRGGPGDPLSHGLSPCRARGRAGTGPRPRSSCGARRSPSRRRAARSRR